MTYEHGKADADAPVTWRHFSDEPEHQDTAWTLRKGFDPMDAMALAVCGSVAQIESICRDAHRAKLAEEAEGLVAEVCGSKYGEAQDWLRRYRAAKGEA